MDNIYLHHDDQQIGPFTEEKIRRYLEEGRIQPTTLGWVEGSDWKPIGEMLGLVSSSPAIQPPPVQVPTNEGKLQMNTTSHSKKKISGCILAIMVIGVLSALSIVGYFISVNTKVDLSKNGDSSKALTLGEPPGSSLVFKGFYLGMQSDDALRLINKHMNLPQVTSEPQAPAITNPIKRDWSTLFGSEDQKGQGSYYIIKKDDEMLIAKTDYADQPFALLDTNGKVIEIRISKDVRDIFFDSKDSTIEEFMQTFIDKYGIPGLQSTVEDINYAGSLAGYQQVYTHRSDKGYEIKFFGEYTPFSQNLTLTIGILGLMGEEGSFILKSIQSKNERSSKFD